MSFKLVDESELGDSSCGTLCRGGFCYCEPPACCVGKVQWPRPTFGHKSGKFQVPQVLAKSNPNKRYFRDQCPICLEREML
jgi:hypothetical protein